MKYAFERPPEHGGDAEGSFQGWRILSQLNCVHGLASQADLFRQFLLGHLSVLKAQPSDFVSDRAHVTHHAGTEISGWQTAGAQPSQE
jgi:hypothetical protein